MRSIIAFAGLLLCVPALADEKIQGWCQDGGYTVSTPGNPVVESTTNVQRSFPGCTVTVYDAGTLDLSTIYSDDSETGKANPFTAANTGQWFFYASNGRYDIRFSGGGIPVPFTLGDHSAFDAAQLGWVNAVDYPGADAGEKINACLVDAAALSFICDARGLTGAQSAAATIVLGSGKLLLGNITLTSSASPAVSFADYGTIIGQSPGVTELTSAQLSIIAPASLLVINNAPVFRDFKVTSTNAGAVRNIDFEKTWRGRIIRMEMAGTGAADSETETLLFELLAADVPTRQPMPLESS